MRLEIVERPKIEEDKFPSLKGTKSIAQGKADGRNPGLITFTGPLPEREQPPASGVAPLQGAEELSPVPGVTLDPLAHPGLLNMSLSATETETHPNHPNHANHPNRSIPHISCDLIFPNEKTRAIILPDGICGGIDSQALAFRNAL